MSIESLSALLDGELRPHELERALDALERDPALREQFDRMVAARAALRGTRVNPGTAGMVERVRAALSEAAPRADRAAASPRRVPRLLWVPLAAAAGVAGFAVIGIGPGVETTPGAAPAPVAAAPVEAAAVVVPVSMSPAAASGATAQPAQNREQLQRYLLIHSQARAEAGAEGSLGFARAVSQDGDATEAEGTK